MQEIMKMINSMEEHRNKNRTLEEIRQIDEKK